MTNRLCPDQNRRSVRTELGLNYLQILSADKERVGMLGNKLKYKNNIDLKKESKLTIKKKRFLPSFDPGMLHL